ncbi:MAG: ANTAR domain-containing protein, partial [Burkholderiaceae bacterium]|nr:ANTAR domain-containing protein [Burkholderiaceae bacterium]
PILDVAMARFQHEQGLRQELAETRTELEQQGAELRARMAELQDRKVIDRAKGLLMQRQNLTEQAAYDKLRKTAMDKSLRLADVAQRMLDVADLLG